MARRTRITPTTGSQAKNTTGQQPNTTKKWKKQVHRVEAGDIVQFHTSNIHIFGAVGTVVGYVSEHEVLIRTFGGSDSDYPPMYMSVYDRQPNENYAGTSGEEGRTLHNYSNWIAKVIHRVNPQQPKIRKRTPVRFLRVNPDALPDVLSGVVPLDKGVHVVVDDTAPAEPEHIEAP